MLRLPWCALFVGVWAFGPLVLIRVGKAVVALVDEQKGSYNSIVGSCFLAVVFNVGNETTALVRLP